MIESGNDKNGATEILMVTVIIIMVLTNDEVRLTKPCQIAPSPPNELVTLVMRAV